MLFERILNSNILADLALTVDFPVTLLITQFRQVGLETETSKNSLYHLFYTIIYAAFHCLGTAKEQISRWHLIAWSFQLSAEAEKCDFILKTKQNWSHFHAHLLSPNVLVAFRSHSRFLRP